jgi:hypothetical protein
LSNDKTKDLNKDWMLTYNNLLRKEQNYASKKCLQSDDLGVVLAHMTEHTHWLPSPEPSRAQGMLNNLN